MQKGKEEDYSDSLLIRQTLTHFVDLLDTGKTTLTTGQQTSRPQRGKNENSHLGHELFLQISGKCEFTFPGNKFMLVPEHILIVPSGLSHQERVIRSRETQFCNLVIIFMKQCTTVHIGRAFHTTGYVPKPIFMEMLNNISSEFYYHSLATCTQLQKKSAPLGAAILCTVLQKVLLDLGAPTRKNVWNYEQDLPQGNPQKIERVKKFIDENAVSHKLDNRSLCKLVGYSPNYLSHLFKKTTGESIREYINRRKMEAGLFLIENTPYSIQEISYKLGYLDPAYFTKLFTRRYGCTPGQLRKQRPQLE